MAGRIKFDCNLRSNFLYRRLAVPSRGAGHLFMIVSQFHVTSHGECNDIHCSVVSWRS